jgi:hypothetical protein
VEPPIAKVEVPKPPAVKVSIPMPVASSPNPVPVQANKKSGESALESMFSFLKSDPNVMLAAQSKVKSTPTAPPAVARALAQSPKSAASDDEDDTPQPKTKLLTIAEARKEAAKVSDAPIAAAVTKTAPVAGSTGGFFDMFTPKLPAQEKKEPAPAAAVATKPVVNTPVPLASVVPTNTVAPATTKTTTSPGGGLFGFLTSTPAPEKEPAPAAAVATKPVSKTSAPVVPVVKASAAPAKTIAPATTKTTTGGGLFGFLTSTPAPEKKEPAPAAAVATKVTEKAGKSPAAATPPVKVVAPTLAKAKVEPAQVVIPKPATTMNAKFTSTVSEALKKDSTKIGLFQTATDNFRSGNSDATSFLGSLEKLFGNNPALLDSLVPQLIAELPEKKVADQLKTVYDKKVVAAKAAASKLPLPIKAPAKVRA